MEAVFENPKPNLIPTPIVEKCKTCGIDHPPAEPHIFEYIFNVLNAFLILCLKKLRCSITMDIFVDPVVLSVCGHTFEKSQIDILIRNGSANGSASCPCCRNKNMVYVPNFAIKDICGELPIICPFGKDLCGQEIKRSELEHHLTICEYGFKKCEKCKLSFKKSEFDEHECVISCKRCKSSFKKSKIDGHECFVSCPNAAKDGCPQLFKYHDKISLNFVKHLNEDCIGGAEICKYCRIVDTRKNMKNHCNLIYDCPRGCGELLSNCYRHRTEHFSDCRLRPGHFSYEDDDIE